MADVGRPQLKDIYFIVECNKCGKFLCYGDQGDFNCCEFLCEDCVKEE